MKVLTDLKLWAYCLWHDYEPTTEIEGWLYESARSIAVAVLILGVWALVMWVLWWIHPVISILTGILSLQFPTGGVMAACAGFTNTLIYFKKRILTHYGKDNGDDPLDEPWGTMHL